MSPSPKERARTTAVISIEGPMADLDKGVSLPAREGTSPSPHFAGVDTDRDRYRSAVRELKRDCAAPQSDRSRPEGANIGV